MLKGTFIQGYLPIMYIDDASGLSDYLEMYYPNTPNIVKPNHRVLYSPERRAPSPPVARQYFEGFGETLNQFL